MAYQTIQLEPDGLLAWLKFNRPEKLNALTRQMLAEMQAAVTEVAADPAVRVLILAGQGRAFMAGADIRQFLDFDCRQAYEFVCLGHRVLQQLAALPLPVLAAVHGFALGGGFEVALACDMIYAASDARFGQPEINLGIMPGLGGSQRLARVLGPYRAKELCLTGRHLTAAEAQQLGLVAQVFPPEELLAQVRKIARTLASKSRPALAQIKKVLTLGAEMQLPAALELEAQAFALLFAGPDPKEGATAFLAKRPPQFQDG